MGDDEYLPNGKGEIDLLSRKVGYRYTGEWKEGLLHGRGTGIMHKR